MLVKHVAGWFLRLSAYFYRSQLRMSRNNYCSENNGIVNFESSKLLMIVGFLANTSNCLPEERKQCSLHY
jgi:hypothetical protein